MEILTSRKIILTNLSVDQPGRVSAFSALWGIRGERPIAASHCFHAAREAALFFFTGRKIARPLWLLRFLCSVRSVTAILKIMNLMVDQSSRFGGLWHWWLSLGVDATSRLSLLLHVA